MSIVIEKSFKAIKDNVGTALEYIDQVLEDNMVNMKAKMQLNIVSDEIIANIVNYAYPKDTGDFWIEIIINDNDTTIKYKDMGIKFNPLEHDDPDVTLSADERDIGGLGIFMIKKMMDEIKYEYEDNKNILTVLKKY